jgi:capsular exopolysaccharide synthesis family protein
MTTDRQDEDSSIDLQQFWYGLKRRWLPASIVVASVFGLTVLWTYTRKPVYESQGKLVFTKKDASSSLAGLSDKLGDISGLTGTSNPVETEAEIMRSYPIIVKVINSLGLKDSKGKQLDWQVVAQNLSLKALRGTDIMQVSYKSTNPQESTKVVNALLKTYLAANIQNNRAEARLAREFLGKQLPEVEQRLMEVEGKLRRFKEQNQVVALEAESKIGLESLGKLDEALVTSQGQLALAESRSRTLQQQMNLDTQQALNATALSQSPSVQLVLTEYQNIQRDIAVAQTTYTRDHPVVVSLALKEAALKQQLERRISQTIGSSNLLPKQNLQIGTLQQSLAQDLVKSEVERLALTNQIAEFRNVYTSNKRRLDSLPRLEQQQLQLQRQLLVAQTTYQEFLKQYQVVQVLEERNVGNARIVAEALVPDRPISPVVALNLSLGAFLGILLGLGTALLLESMDKSIKNIEQVKRLLDLPLLAMIPLMRESKASISDSLSLKELPMLNAPYSPISNAFQMLQTGLKFSIPDKKLKVILVTSSSPSEGKSFIAANLAVAASAAGQKVLLIDADMRRPRQHKIWEIRGNLLGLSNILVSQISLQKAVHRVSPQLQLDVLLSGVNPPNPIRLLDSHSMSTLIEDASQDYDLVIIDSPPATVVADSMIVGKFADGVLLVIRPGQADAAAVKLAKSLLDQAKVPILGMLINGVNEDNSYGGYYYNQIYYQEGNKALPIAAD